MKIMAGIDLHSNNALCALVDQDGKRLCHRKLPCRLPTILKFFEPYKKQLDTIAVESTYNWYWLVDGLQDAGYHVVLANPAAMKQYSGIKETNDVSDGYFLGDLLRLGILPVGTIADRKTRPVRDLLRRRMLFVNGRTTLILSFKSLTERTLGKRVASYTVKTMSPQDAADWFETSADRLLSREEIGLIGQFNDSIKRIEKEILSVVGNWSVYKRLKSIPGIGPILGMMIALETGDIARFASAGNFASYCRCVQSRRTSNQKKKGENNRKCGNKYLSWAFVEAAHFSCRYNEQCRRFYNRKKQKTNVAVATKALACKLAKAAWHVMSQDVQYDARRIFGGGGK